MQLTSHSEQTQGLTPDQEPSWRSRMMARLRSRPVILVGVVLVGIGLGVGTFFLNRSFDKKRRQLAVEWMHRGEADMKSGRLDQAILDFRTALLYDRENSATRLRLAQALLAAGAAQQPPLDEPFIRAARSHLLQLWDEEPGDGFINLELARLSAHEHDLQGALRFYHAALYGLWTQEAESRRRQARLELVEFLLQSNAGTQARSELIALSTSLPNQAEAQLQLGDLFLRAQDYESALKSFERVLRSDPNNRAAMRKAGEAAFDLARFRTARRYLQFSVTPEDVAGIRFLETAEAVLHLSPYSYRLSPEGQYHRLYSDFKLAGDLLEQCSQSKQEKVDVPRPATLLQQSYSRWKKYGHFVDLKELQADPGFIDQTMDLIQQIGIETKGLCPPATTEQNALMLVARYGDEVER